MRSPLGRSDARDPRSRWRNKPRMRLPTKGLLREQPEFGGNHKAAAGGELTMLQSQCGTGLRPLQLN